jgi:hypothetical protein
MLTNGDLQAIRGIVKEEVEPVKKAVQNLEIKLDKAQEDISEILTVVIAGQDKLTKRVDKIEEHLDIHNSH